MHNEVARIPELLDAPETSLATRYRTIRKTTESLAAPLTAEDCAIQSMTECSPTRWHLAHTTWFWETFILKNAGKRAFRPEFEYLFNSYYNAVGAQFPRDQRGLLSRPGLEEVYRYRAYVDEAIEEVLETGTRRSLGDVFDIAELGLAHEQQHQELILTDIKHALSINPLHPRYRDCEAAPRGEVSALGWQRFRGGRHEVGHESDEFAFDNESPRHAIILQDFALATRPVTNGEYLQFVEDGGYRDPACWLSDGWATVLEHGWAAPLYWRRDSGGREAFTLGGLRELDPAAPVTHISYYEADAFARWAGCRLPTEFEWERASSIDLGDGHFLDDGHFHPAASSRGRDAAGGLQQMMGDVWEWTSSPYAPYPGYRTAQGAIGEYNGKFMCNQMVLRGGSCVTPRSHVRNTYRNFFPPEARWQFSGIRLAKDGR